ncbi:MAG: YlxR family protein [Mycobacteriales bacterium]
MHVVRTCIGCRKRACISELFRLTLVNQGGVWSAVPDISRRLPGRGAWLHSSPACLALAERRRAFGRALRHVGTIDIGPVQDRDTVVTGTACHT